MIGNFLFDWLQLALSLFSCILLLWLGLTMLLNSEQRTGSVLLVSGMALLGSAFFAAHTALLQIAGHVAAPSLDFWWQTGWLMLVALPYGWYLIVLWFGGYGDKQSPLRLHHRGPAALLGITMAGLLAVLMLASPLPSIAQLLALQPVHDAGVMGLPWFLALYPLYTLACMALAFAALRNMAPAQAALGLARSRARPWVLATTGLLTGVNLLGAWAIAWFQTLPRNGTVSVSAVLAGAGRFDLAVSTLLAIAIVLIGQAMVQYEIFSGRTLPRRELRRHWNYALVLAGGYGIIVGGSLAYGLRPIYDLLLSAILMASLFALTGWRTFTRQQAFMRRLQPFVASTHLYEQLTAQPGLQVTMDSAEDEKTGGDMAGVTFTALCQDVLNTDYAVLMAAGPLAMLTHKPLVYPPAAQPPAPGEWLQLVARSPALCLPLRVEDAPQAAWAIPLHSERQFIGTLLLGNRNDGGMYTQEEIEVARATGERLIDLRAGAELAYRLLKVQRTRLVESTVVDRQTRRVLHDDVLPDLHTALLLLDQERSGDASTNLTAASDLLMNAHRRISELLRALPIRPALQPGGGILPSLRHLLATDFGGQFDRVEWNVTEEAEALADNLPSVTAEVVFYALREAIRNAVRYGRGGDESRALALHISACVADGLHITVHDDGVGMDFGGDQEFSTTNGAASSGAASSGQGLSLHTALLAVVGASMSVNTVPSGGAHIAIDLPLAACGDAHQARSTVIDPPSSDNNHLA